MRRALELEPLSLSCRTNYALDLHWAGRSQEALQEFDKILDQDPASIGALETLRQIQEELGKIPEALSTTQKLVALGGISEKAVTTLQNALGAQGARGYWAQRVRQVEQKKDLDPVRLAEVVALQGDKDRVFRLLDRAIQQQSPFLIYVPKAPAFEPLRQDPRFTQLLKRMSYPST
jgi:serine/threonine-protein kinase